MLFGIRGLIGLKINFTYLFYTKVKQKETYRLRNLYVTKFLY